ncbi:hypothetical protein A2U01_0068009 [Trifolium medium]|uniref:Uncharacterized protein n=1 Tax=Trifolium medium TaxID=97028 RepID=A0A392SD16_9FABA|nr:hypothetical protein [Trifolium medium]
MAAFSACASASIGGGVTQGVLGMKLFRWHTGIGRLVGESGGAREKQ